jgi:hypothetical protein
LRYSVTACLGVLLGALVLGSTASATSDQWEDHGYTSGGIDEPSGIAVGPDKAISFTNYSGNSTVRIITRGKVTNYT